MPRADEIFFRAIELEPPEQTAYLEAACEGDSSLRAEVERLLEVDAGGGSFLRPATQSRAGGDWIDRTGQTVGAYRLTRLIGRGGMGEVYLGERDDAAFRKQVAVKVIRPGRLDSDSIRRFNTERRVLATLEHPNIARLLDGGIAADGMPYLIMERIEGLPIDRHVMEKGLAIPERLRLLQIVCDAVHYAHRRLIVHRDLKPSNILVDAEGQPKLLDFGIVKVLDPSSGDDSMELTATGMQVLTPKYASPEQLTGGPITTATDIYLLGLLAFEVLTGRLPFELQTPSPAEMERAVREREPTRPSVAAMRSDADALGSDPRKMSRMLEGDVDTIVLKALQKDPARRYASSADLAKDIDRFLAGLPIEARPDTMRYRVGKFVRRNSVAVLGALIGVVSLLAAAVISTTLFLRADQAQQDAEGQRKTAVTVSDFLQEMLGSLDPVKVSGRDAAVFREIVDEAAQRLEREVDPSSEAAASLHFTIGKNYRALALHDDAERHLRAALDAAKVIHGEDHPSSVDALTEIGILHYDRAEYVEADSVLSIALAKLREFPDPAPTQVASLLGDLAAVRERSGRGDAESLYREALELLEAAVGADHPDVAQASMEFGGFLLYHGGPSGGGRLDEAEVHLERAVRIFERDYGRQSAEFSDAIHNLSSLERRRGNLEAALSYIREALAILERMYEPDHPKILISLNALASTLEDLERSDEAEIHYRRVLAGQVSLLGAEHVDVGTTCNNLAGLLAATGRYDEAEPLYEQAADVYRNALGPDHAWVAIVLLNVAVMYGEERDCESANRVLDECDRIGSLYWPESHFRFRVTESIRSACRVRQGEFEVEVAEPTLIAAFEALRAELGEENRHTRLAARNLVDLYEAWGQPGEARRYRNHLAEDPSP